MEKNNDEDMSQRIDCYKGLTMSIKEWLKLYSNFKTLKCRSKLRNVSIAMANLCSQNKTVISDPGTFASKFVFAAPYYFFLTTVGEAKSTFSQPFSITFHEIIDYTLGEIVDSLHIGYAFDLHWLIIQYMIAAQNIKITMICQGLSDKFCLKESNPFDLNILLVPKLEFGIHHCKLSILKYKNNTIRILIYTFEFTFEDCQASSHGIWVSPPLPCLPETSDSSDGESVTNFKRDVIEYLTTYNTLKMHEFFKSQTAQNNISIMSEWINLIQRADCSAVNVFFIASVPGHHEGSNLNKWGCKKLTKILSEHAVLPSDEKNWPIVAQSSTIGTFGQNYYSWLLPQIVGPMSGEKDKRIIFLPEFKFIYASKRNFEESYDKKINYHSTEYEKRNYLSQLWLKDYLYQWKSEKFNRTLSLPRTRTYTRISPDRSEIAWFVLTSSNLSKGAWGKMLGENCQYICNHETGVVFMPEIIINRTTFPIRESKSFEVPVFLLPYDLPLTPYQPDDEPYVSNMEDLEEYHKRYCKEEYYDLLDIQNVGFNNYNHL